MEELEIQAPYFEAKIEMKKDLNQLRLTRLLLIEMRKIRI